MRCFIFIFLSLILLSQQQKQTLASRNRQPFLRDGFLKAYNFRFVPEFSDEFRGKFNHTKWYNMNPRWKGRQPGLFASKNVAQRRGQLWLKGRYEKSSKPFKDAPEGYEKYTTSFVMSKKNARYGYFEVLAKPSNSRLSSSFWGSLDTPKLWTEIDVFELGGGVVHNGVDQRRRVNMNLHVFRHLRRGIKPGQSEVSKPYYYVHSSYLRSRFNRYGLDWAKNYITWTFNGRPIRRERNRLWHQAFPIKFDVETMPLWFGLPSRKTLPAIYKLRYIRSWRRYRKKKSRTAQRKSQRWIGNIWGSVVGGQQSTESSTDAQSITTTDDSTESTEDDEVDDDLGDAPLEIYDSEVEESIVPVDGLQRAPIPGTNERIYAPVLPPGESSWTRIIDETNRLMEDVAGALLEIGEQINIGDFANELVWFQNSAVPQAEAVEDDSAEDSGEEEDEEDEGDAEDVEDEGGDLGDNGDVQASNLESNEGAENGEANGLFSGVLSSNGVGGGFLNLNGL